MSGTKTIWIITRAINQYDQDGEYFFAAFTEKPTRGELQDLGFADVDIIHLLKGGGRRNYEDQWFFLTEVKSGQEYDK